MREVLLKTTGLSAFYTAILRNFNMVGTEELAGVFGCYKNDILETAKLLGLKEKPFDDKWIKRGYQTIIRNNWHILPTEQIIKLLGWNNKKFDYVLKEEDFFWSKLGAKTQCENVVFAKPTQEELLKLEKVKKIITSLNLQDDHSFEFFTDKFEDTEPKSVKIDDGIRMVSSYNGSCGDSLMSEKLPFSEDLLHRLSASGINAVWMPVLLHELSPYPFDSSLSEGYETRLENLNKLINLAEKYSIQVFLYFNEPRCQSDEFFTAENEDIRGTKYNGRYGLCTSNARVKEYLVTATEFLLTRAKKLGGIFTITTSENHTNCCSHVQRATTCPICSKRNNVDVIVEVNNLIMQGIKRSGAKAKLIAWNWNQNQYTNFDRAANLEFVKKLDKDILFMCVSEDCLEYFIDGKKQDLSDYSISKAGPSEKSMELWNYANSINRKTVAKVQINNSWELCCAPFIPVFPTYIQHFKNLHKLKINNYMLTWTLGGYPGGALKLASYDYSRPENDILQDFLTAEYGKENLNTLTKAVTAFSEGFSNYPFCIGTLYRGAQNYSVSNPFFPEFTDMSATMIGYPYDNWENWITPYKLETYLAKLENLLVLWENGLKELQNITPNSKTQMLIDVSRVCYISFKSLYNQCLFYANRDKKLLHQIDVSAVIENEKTITKQMLDIVATNPYIGFEASNHYLFSQNNLVEKLINLENLIALKA